MRGTGYRRSFCHGVKRTPLFRRLFLCYTSRMLFLLFALGTVGLCVGSFLNVVILRRGRQSMSRRSACMSCGNTLAWYDMIPIASWIILRGRCRACGSSISSQYPLVEAATAILFALFGCVYWALMEAPG